jgi:hypothetical protein
MTDFINTIDALGDDAVIDSIIERTITEFKDDKLEIIGDGAFRGSNALKTVILKKATHISGTAFAFCNALESVVLESATYLGGDTFTYGGIKLVDLHKAPIIYMKVFYGCGAFSTLIIRDTEKLASIANTAVFSGSPISKGTGYIYVPRALVDSYKAATNWSAFASQFRALEDYTVDGTVTGALDETKI